MKPQVEIHEDPLSVLNKKIPLSEKIRFIHKTLKDLKDLCEKGSGMSS